MVQIDVGGDKGFFGSADTAVLAVIASDIFVFGPFFNSTASHIFSDEEIKTRIGDSNYSIR